MNERDFSINGVNFKLSKLTAFQQFHIARMIAPIMSDIMKAAPKVMQASKDIGGLTESEKFEKLAKFAEPILSGFAKLSEEDSNKVLLGLLSGVEMQQPQGNWAKIAKDQQLMFQNLELPAMLQAAGRSFMFNMSGFFSASPLAFSSGELKQKDPSNG